MKSYTGLRADYQEDTKNTSAANLTFGTTRMNDFHRRLLTRADWPFLHRVRTVTTVAPSSTFTAVAATDICTATGDTILTHTGIEVTFTTTGTLPAGLSTSTTYYLVYQTATTFKVATSLANAYAGTAVDITDTGSGTHTTNVQTRTQPLPYDVDQVGDVSVVVSSTRYSPSPAPSREFWDKLNYNDQKSDIPEWWFVEDGRLGLWPRPSNDGNVVTLVCKVRVPDLNVADYTTGNIDIVTNGSVSVTGAGSPAWTTPMAGRWIRIAHSNTAASSGDGEWYEINSVESSTVLTLVRPYGGRSLTTGAAASYTIGQMPLLPEAYHDLPEIYASYRYWAKEKGNEARAAEFKGMLAEGLGDLFRAYSINDLSMVLDSGDDQLPLNPNLTVTL